MSVVANGRASSLLLLLMSISNEIDLPCPLSNSLHGIFLPSPVSSRFSPLFPLSLDSLFFSSCFFY